MKSRPEQPAASPATRELDADRGRAARREDIRQAAVERDVSAERRDRAAEVRDDAAQLRRAALAGEAPPDWLAHDRAELADRAASSLDRIHAGRDRDAAASDLANLSELSRLDRLAAADVLDLSDAEPLPPAGSAT